MIEKEVLIYMISCRRGAEMMQGRTGYEAEDAKTQRKTDGNRMEKSLRLCGEQYYSDLPRYKSALICG